ncbi:MAG TPA: TonB family protein [Pyrinomonadaceae bacterium]|nr:TonB family protein [Pyrinomonadaceae bacterium]
MAFRITLLILLTAVAPCVSSTQAQDGPATIALVQFSDSDLGRNAAQTLAASLRSLDLHVLDLDQTRAAVQGAGYAPSLNMAVTEALTLGAVIGSDFYVLGDVQTLRRSPSSGQVYFESYASLFLVSARTGRLISWQRLNFQSPKPAESEKLLLNKLSGADLRNELLLTLLRSRVEERRARVEALGREVPVIEAAPDDEKIATAKGMRLPRPFRRLQPDYPDSAAAAEVEAVVDVLVDLDERGEVTNARIERWAGFGLDEVTLNTVYKLHFFPAMRDGSAIPLRVLLRYNFRKPPR